MKDRSSKSKRTASVIAMLPRIGDSIRSFRESQDAIRLITEAWLYREARRISKQPDELTDMDARVLDLHPEPSREGPSEEDLADLGRWVIDRLKARDSKAFLEVAKLADNLDQPSNARRIEAATHLIQQTKLLGRKPTLAEFRNWLNREAAKGEFEKANAEAPSEEQLAKLMSRKGPPVWHPDIFDKMAKETPFASLARDKRRGKKATASG